MTQENEDIQRAALYLRMDEKELANVRAENEKYERRKAAMAYGAASADVEPITFAPSYCLGCDILLTRQNHGDSGRCSDCHFESCALAWAETKRQERQSKKLAEAKAAGLIMMGYVLFLCACAAFGAYGLSRAVNALAWWIGGALP